MDLYRATDTQHDNEIEMMPVHIDLKVYYSFFYYNLFCNFVSLKNHTHDVCSQPVNAPLSLQIGREVGTILYVYMYMYTYLFVHRNNL